jgi:hypothetical protein
MHEQAGEGRRGAVVVDTSVGLLRTSGGIVDGPGDGDFGRRSARVGDAIAQDGDRKTALVRLVRDERGEGFERDADGEDGVGEIDARERKLAGESRIGEADEARGVLGAESAGAFIGRLYARFEDTGDGLARAGLRPDGRECVRGRVALVGAIEDLPVA